MKTRTARQIVSGNLVHFVGKIAKIQYERYEKQQVGRAHNILRKRRKIERQNKRVNRPVKHRGGGKKYGRPNHKDRVKTSGKSKQKEATS
jgi:hypothetical protein